MHAHTTTRHATPPDRHTPSEHRLREAGLPVTDLGPVLAEETDPLLFATVSGAHLYGFPSRDSDIDLRGVHVLPVEALVGLDEPDETRTRMGDRDGVEMDLVTHDLRKFARLMLRRNGYVLEQLLSPLVVHTTGAHSELASLAPGLLTAHHAHHYAGFAATQERLFERTGELKPLLYTFRALLTGVHLMRGGGIEAHLPTLLGEVAAPAVPAGTDRREGRGRARYGRSPGPGPGREGPGGAPYGPGGRQGGHLATRGARRRRPGRAARPGRPGAARRAALTRGGCGSGSPLSGRGRVPGGEGEAAAASSAFVARRFIRRSTSGQGTSPRLTASSGSRSVPTSMTSRPVRSRSPQSARSRSRCMACFQRGAPCCRTSASSFRRWPSAYRTNVVWACRERNAPRRDSSSRPVSSRRSTSGECRHSSTLGLARSASAQKRSSSQENCSSAGPSTCAAWASRSPRTARSAPGTPPDVGVAALRRQAERPRPHHTGIDGVVTHESVRREA